MLSVLVICVFLSVLFSGLATPQLGGFSSNDLTQTKCVQRPSRCCTRRCGFRYHESCCWTLLCCIAATVKNAKNQKCDASQLTPSIWGEFHKSKFSHSYAFRSDSLRERPVLFFWGDWQLPFEGFIRVSLQKGASPGICRWFYLLLLSTKELQRLNKRSGRFAKFELAMSSV